MRLEAWLAAPFGSLSGWLREAAITAGLLAAAFLAGRAARWAWHRLILPLARRAPARLDSAVLAAGEGPLARAVAMLVAYAAVRRLTELPGLGGTLGARILDGLFFALMVLTLARLAVAVADAVSRWYLSEVAVKTASPLDEHFVPLVGKLVAVGIYFIGATVVLDRFGVDVTALVTTAGVASLALALAAQETLANMFAGFAIMLDRSYRVGDRIQLADGTVGDVQEIGLRATKLLSFDHELIIVPNKEMAAARIINQSYPDLRVTVRVRVGVAYGTDVEHAKRVLREVCLAHPDVLKEPAPAAYFTDFGDSALNLLAVCWVADYRSRFKVLDELNTAIKKRFEEEGIEIPYPQRVLHVHGPWSPAADAAKARPPSGAPAPGSPLAGP